MASLEIVRHCDLILKPDPARTVLRPFEPGDPEAYSYHQQARVARVAERVLAADEATQADELAGVLDMLGKRHRDVPALLDQRYAELKEKLGAPPCSADQARLIAAYLSEEYSFEAAALFNPSIVEHWDQSGLEEGDIRFILSLRGIGEGHISSVTFRTGIWRADGRVEITEPSPTAIAPTVKMRDGDSPDAEVTLDITAAETLSEVVLFPLLPRQRQGIEDLRLVRFTDEDGTSCHCGTFTAFGGGEVRQEILHTGDFETFTMRPVTGVLANSKGMALFPRRIDGRYVALGRQDNENIWLMWSDDLYHWDEGMRLIRPEFPWEYVQVGNCGSPIELDEGWLVITHGVGMVRNYCMGASLLDKEHPARVLARTARPVLWPSDRERAGYVPNVVYSCGAMLRGRTLLLPYGVADNFSAFATIAVDDLLAAMEPVAG